MRRLHLVIRGRVQGVGFRWYVARHAGRLGVCGRVRNRDDGAVEVDSEGTEANLRELEARLWEGPPASAVTTIEASWSEGPARWTTFEIRST